MQKKLISGAQSSIGGKCCIDFFHTYFDKIGFLRLCTNVFVINLDINTDLW